MGLRLWTQTLIGRNVARETSDHVMLHDFAEELDALCEELNVATVSSFFDFTVFHHQLSANPDQEPDYDRETGWPYGIDQMQWHDANAGLAAVNTLEKHLRAHADAMDLTSEERAELLNELNASARLLKPVAAAGGKFHFAVVM
jgi:hypothetical protein